MRCLIIAAGQGRRLRSKAEVKPLVPLLGIPLIERNVRAAAQAGVDGVCVVTGYQGERVARFLADLCARLELPLSVVHNERWNEENGLSVLRARGLFDEPFLLMMADHLVDPANIRRLMAEEIDKDEIVLAVDTRTDDPLVDVADATKVRILDGRIAGIGKQITEFDAFDTGLFLCTPAVFDALEKTCGHGSDTTLTAAVRLLAQEGRARVVAVSGYWVDVDDARACDRAERTLLELCRKPTDGPVSRWVNRPLSLRLTRLLARWNISPNQISIAAFLLALAAAGLIAAGSYVWLAAGGLLAQLASVVDGVDGEIARLKYRASDYGRWLDAVLDRYADAALICAVAWHAYGTGPSTLPFLVGMAALIGSFMVSYTADKYDALMKKRAERGVRIGRDLRLGLIFAGALLDQAFWLLVAMAAVMNVEALRRIIVCRDERRPAARASQDPGDPLPVTRP